MLEYETWTLFIHECFIAILFTNPPESSSVGLIHSFSSHKMVLIHAEKEENGKKYADESETNLELKLMKLS